MIIGFPYLLEVVTCLFCHPHYSCTYRGLHNRDVPNKHLKELSSLLYCILANFVGLCIHCQREEQLPIASQHLRKADHRSCLTKNIHTVAPPIYPGAIPRNSYYPSRLLFRNKSLYASVCLTPVISLRPSNQVTCTIVLSITNTI